MKSKAGSLRLASSQRKGKSGARESEVRRVQGREVVYVRENVRRRTEQGGGKMESYDIKGFRVGTREGIHNRIKLITDVKCQFRKYDNMLKQRRDVMIV